MKKLTGFLAALMILCTSLVYAGGHQMCGDNAAGPAGEEGQGTVERSRAAAD